MIAIVRKNVAILISKQTSNSVSVWKSPISRRFLSNSTETQIGISTTLLYMLRDKYDFPPELASRIASQMSSLKTSENADSILSFLKESGFSNSYLQKIVKQRPRILAANLEDSIRPKIKILQDVGFQSDEVCKLISSNATILCLSVNDNIIPTFSVLKGLLGSNSDVISLVRKWPRLLMYNMEGTVVANVELLKSIGVSMDRIRIILIGCPQVFCQNPEVIRRSVEKANEMGLTASMKAFIYAISTIASVTAKAWELKLQAFRDVGYSDSEILRMFSKEPRVFGGSIEKMKNITEGLVATGRFDISSIAHYPSSLMFSFEKRYMPRIRILKILESRNLIETWPTLRTLCCSSDAEVFKIFVSPYLDKLSDVDIPKLSAIDKVKIKS